MAWFKNWFNTPYYHILYKDRNFAEAEDFISLLVEKLNLESGSCIIDLACGKGRHSRFLQSIGYNVLGLDLSEESIDHNLETIENSLNNSSIDFKVHDMRSPILGNVIDHKVDAVFNLFTSFGYFETVEDDEKVFASVYDSLKEGGLFVLDFLNENYVKKNLLSENKIKKSGIDFLISKRIENYQVIKDIRFEDNGEEFHYFEKVKLHTEMEIQYLAEKFNFERIFLFGNYKLEKFDVEQSPRCITIFRKK